MEPRRGLLVRSTFPEFRLEGTRPGEVWAGWLVGRGLDAGWPTWPLCAGDASRCQGWPGRASSQRPGQLATLATYPPGPNTCRAAVSSDRMNFSPQHEVLAMPFDKVDTQ